MKKEPEISIILPCRNEEEAVGFCLKQIKEVIKTNNLNAEIIFNRFKNAYLVFQKTEETLVYTVISGDTLWIISNVFGVSINQIKELNNFSTDSLNIGQKLILRNFSQTESIIKGFTSSNATLFSAMSLSSSAIGYLKAWTSIDIVGKNGDWYKVNTIKGTGYIYKTCIYIGQDIIDNQPNSTYFNNSIPVDSSLDFVTYSNYSIVRGDTLWNLSIKFGIPNYELMQINNFNESSILNIGQVIKYPIHTIPVKDSIAPQYGEVLDWFKEGQYVFPIGKVGKFIDVETGKSFYATRTTGANHADTEALTSNDATIMKQIFGGIWNWNKREFILEVDNRKIAVSVAGMPHAGVDGAPYLSNVANRSDDWGYGPNYDSISGNGMSGHFDVYTLNCLRHKDNKIDSVHQYNVLSAGGLK